MSEDREPLLLPHAEQSPEIDWQQASRAWQTFLQRFQQEVFLPVTKAFEKLTEALQPTFQVVAAVAEHVSNVLWEAYREDGAIYGETQEGFLRWMKEKAEIEHLRMQAECIEQHQAMIRDFKQQLAQRREQKQKNEEDIHG
jgi:hypothetical protein